MKRLILLALLACVIVGGCATYGETPYERDARIQHNWDLQSRQLVEDWDYIWLVDQPTMMTDKFVYTGMP